MTSRIRAAAVLQLTSLGFGGIALAGPHTALVGVPKGQHATQILQSATRLGATRERCFDLAGVCVVDFKGAPPIAALSALPGVRYAYLDKKLDMTPAGASSWPDAAGTTECSDQWEINKIAALTAWDIADGTSAPTIAIEDVGFLTSHEELSTKIADAYDYGDDDTDAGLDSTVSFPGHGTFAAAILAGDSNNGKGRAGIAPGADMYLQKVEDSTGSFLESYVVLAMADVVADGGIRVLSFSLTVPSVTPALEDSVSALGAANVLLVAAAGTCGADSCDDDTDPKYPASYDGEFILSVGATTEDDGLSNLSNYGATTVDLGAPGANICSAGATADDAYETGTGTSYAVPMVAATADLLFEAYPLLTNYDVARIILASVDAAPELDGKVATGGRLSAGNALNTPFPVFTAPGTPTVNGDGGVAFKVTNEAAAGDYTLVIVHDAGITAVSGTGDTTTTTYDPGSPVTLPDVGLVTVADNYVTVITGTLAVGENDITIVMDGAAVGTSTNTVRVIADSTYSGPLQSPYEDDTAIAADETGAAAWPLIVTVTAVGSGSDTGTDDTSTPTDDTSTPTDDTSTPTDDTSTGGDDTGTGSGTAGNTDTASSSKDKGCGCATTPASPAGLLLMGTALGLAFARRRR